MVEQEIHHPRTVLVELTRILSADFDAHWDYVLKYEQQQKWEAEHMVSLIERARA